MALTGKPASSRRSRSTPRTGQRRALGTARRLLPLLLVGLLGTAGRKRKDATPPPMVLEAAEQATEDRGAAIAALEAYLADSPDPELAPWVQIWAGEQRRIAGDRPIARGGFEATALEHPGHITRDAAVLGMALVDAEDNLSGNTIATIQLKDTTSAPDTMRADRLRVLARDAANSGTPTRRVRELAAEARRLAQGDPVVSARVELVLADLLADDPSASGLTLTDASGSPLSPEAAALSRIRRAMADHRLDEVIAQADALIASAPDTAEAAAAVWQKKRAEAGDPTVAGRVAVMLPL